jgi:hypothetical protein
MQCEYAQNEERPATSRQPFCFHLMSTRRGNKTVIESGVEDIKGALSYHLVWCLWLFDDLDRLRNPVVRAGGVRDM